MLGFLNPFETRPDSDARRLAERNKQEIEDYWSMRGYKVDVEIRYWNYKRGPCYELRSSLFNGLPPNYKRA